MCHAKGVLLGQVVDREGSPVPQCHSLAQQRGGGAQLELLALDNRKRHTCGQEEPAPPCSEARTLHTAGVVQSHPGGARSLRQVKGRTCGLSVMST